MSIVGYRRRVSQAQISRSKPRSMSRDSRTLYAVINRMLSLVATSGAPISTSMAVSSTHNYKLSSLEDPNDHGALQKAIETILGYTK